MRLMDARAFSKFEMLAQRLVEGAFGRLFGGRSLAADVAAHLADTLEESWQAGETANEIHLHFHPADYATLQQPQDLEARLARYVRDLARQGGIVLSGPVRVVLEEDGTVAPRGVHIQTVYRKPEETVTGTLGQEVAQAYDQLRALDAFLIVNGRRHVPLDRPIVTIGRRMDNDVIIDSPVVSRQHAHLRWRYGRFVLYDAGSRGGVAVNGEPCTECVLQPGDLITLSGRVSLIYGEGLERRDELPASQNGSQETLTLTRDDLA